MSRTNFEELLEAGVHFGHLKRKWNPAMAPYIFMERNGIHIIDLEKTAVKIEEASAKKKAKAFEKLEIKELKKLKRKFAELVRLIEESKAIKIKLTDTRGSPDEFKKEEEYYFLQILRFASTYTSILEGLITKEDEILRRFA